MIRSNDVDPQTFFLFAIQNLTVSSVGVVFFGATADIFGQVQPPTRTRRTFLHFLRISDAIKNAPPEDVRFSSVVEKLSTSCIVCRLIHHRRRPAKPPLYAYTSIVLPHNTCSVYTTRRARQIEITNRKLHCPSSESFSGHKLRRP